MIIISVSKRKLKLVAAVVLAVLLTIAGINQIFGGQKTEKFKELVEALRLPEIDAPQEILTSTSPTPNTGNEVQIFNVEKGKIVKRMKASNEIQAEAKNIINSVTGLYTKVRPLPSKGYIVKIPVNPALKVQNKYINSTVNTIYVILTEKEPPVFLILDENDKPFVYNFEVSTEKLKEYLDFNFAYE